MKLQFNLRVGVSTLFYLAFQVLCINTELAPVLSTGPTDQKVLSQSIASFFCAAHGDPAPSFSWHKNGRTLGRSYSRYMIIDVPNGSVLRIEPVKATRDNAAMITCMASNGIGEPAFADALLTVYEDESDLPDGFPVITDSPYLKAVQKDRNTVMTCAADGDPQPMISWLRDYVPINLSEPRYTVLPTGSLQILNSKEQDEGKYECVAQNEHGLVFSYSANLYVRVRRVPPHFSLVSEDQEVLSGGDVNLTCIAVGSPMPYVRWRLGGVPLTPEESVLISKNELMLSDITESGTYTCLAASYLGTIERNVQVTVKDELMSDKETTTSELMSDKETTTAELISDKETTTAELMSDKDTTTAELISDKETTTTELSSYKDTTTAELLSDKEITTAEPEYVTTVGKAEEVVEGSSSEKLIADGLTQMAAGFNKIAEAVNAKQVSSLFAMSSSCSGNHLIKNGMLAIVASIENMAQAVDTKQCLDD